MLRFLAITNHNHFDLEQYLEFKSNVNGICQIGLLNLMLLKMKKPEHI
jgi:hypothetical protein